MRFYKDPQKIYLDSAKAGPMYYELLDWRYKYERKSLVEKSQIRNNHENLLKEVENKIGNFFNVKDGNIFFTSSFSMGFHSLVNQFKRKPSFLVLEDDYPSISEAIINKGFEIIYVKNDAFVEKNIENAVKKYKPNFIAISIVQWIDGLKIDIDFLKYLKKKYSEISIIADGTQFCGTSKFDFSNSPFDVLISSGYKWMLSGYGVAFILVKKNFYLNKFFNCNYNKLKKLIEIGHYDMLSIGSLGFSIDKLKPMIGKVEKQLKNFSKFFKKELESINMLDEKLKIRKSHSTIFNLKDSDNKLFKHLTNNKIICSQRGMGVRVSFNFFNTKSDIKKLINALKKFNLQP